MTEQEMKRLSRAEMLEVILLQSQQIDQLQGENEELRRQVEDKRIAIDEAGSLAEASLKLNGIFEDAERAVAQYKENIARLSQDAEGIARGKLMETRRQAEMILQEAQQKANAITAQAETQKAKARREADAYWSEVSAKLETLLNARAGLRELLSLDTDGKKSKDE